MSFCFPANDPWDVWSSESISWTGVCVRLAPEIDTIDDRGGTAML